MPRGPRGLIDGGTYHVLTRGNNGQCVFHHDVDFQRYVELLGTYVSRHRLKLYHFALLPNEAHLVLELASAESLSKAMLGLNLSYTLFYHRRYEYEGHLWQGRFKTTTVDRKHALLMCGRLIELAPVRAGLADSPAEYPWSSYRAYAEDVRPALLAPHPDYHALGTTPQERQQRYRRFIQVGLQSLTAKRGHPISPGLTHPDARFGLFAFNGRPPRPKKCAPAAPSTITPLSGHGE